MPFSYPETSRLKDAIIARVTAGERLKHVCADPDMPCYGTIYLWRRRDPDFAKACDLAWIRGADRRNRFDDSRAAEIVARRIAGERLVDILREPGMPSRCVVRRWVMTQGHFAAELHRVRVLRTAERVARNRRRFRAFDPQVADRIYARMWRGESLRKILASDPQFPVERVLARWRREQPQFDAMLRFVISVWTRRRRPTMLTSGLRDVIAARVVTGASLKAISRDPRMPCATTLYKWVRVFPEFAATIAGARETREDWCIDRIQGLDVPGAGADDRHEVRRLKARLRRLHRQWERET